MLTILPMLTIPTVHILTYNTNNIYTTCDTNNIYNIYNTYTTSKA